MVWPVFQDTELMRKKRTGRFNTQLKFMKTHTEEINFLGMQGAKIREKYNLDKLSDGELKDLWGKVLTRSGATPCQISKRKC